MKIIYKINQSKTEDISTHLRECNLSFIPPLEQRTNIDTYSQKIFQNADTLEAWNNNHLIGLLAVYLDYQSKQAFITSISVANSYRNKGIASELLKKCIAHVKRLKLNCILLRVNAYNLTARHLYEKHNFKQVYVDSENNILMRHELQ